MSISDEERRSLLLQLSRRLRHRGPDWSGLWSDSDACLCHERLAIVDPNGEAQPLFGGKQSSCVLIANGEIYNHVELRARFLADASFKTASDCECIAHLFELMGVDLVKELDGDFAFLVYDSATKKYMAARDPLGVNPLYYAFQDGAFWVASELKALQDQVTEVHVFPPGHYYTPETGFVRYYSPSWVDPNSPLPSAPVDLVALRTAFEAAVEKRLMCDAPYGVLLSGGLDSSLVASVASRFAANRVEDRKLGVPNPGKAWFPTLHTFSIGTIGASDLPYARQVADFIGSKHHEFHFTVQQGLDALRDVIWHLETFDVTTIRASTPMYLLSRKIKAMGIKMVLSGEGSDELFAGYLYFSLAPSPEEIHKEVVSRVLNLHLADNLRANKSTMAFGVEARVPFLDKDVIDIAMTMDPKEKMHHHEKKDAQGRGMIEKYWLRKAFDTPDHPYLPAEVLWRQKEQFSDGCGYSWIDTLRSECESRISDADMASAAQRFPHLTPQTKEAYYYRTIFSELFNEAAGKTVMAWTPAWSKSKDPSGRAQAVHEKTIAATL